MTCRANVDHEAVKLDSARWAQLQYVAEFPDEDDNGNPIALEMRNCPCGSTLARSKEAK